VGTTHPATTMETFKSFTGLPHRILDKVDKENAFSSLIYPQTHT